MNEQEAKKLVEETFKNSFSKKRFTFFVKNFLNEIDQDELVLHDSSVPVPNSYEKYIKNCERITRYTDPEGGKLDVLAVNLRRETSPVRARTMQRNFIGWYLRNEGYRRDNALVAFYHENVDDWRFSYVERNYFSEKDETTGKIKAGEDITSAKRFSFLVGENEPSHTAQNQIVPILINDKDNPTISDIATAFNIETVTNEFFVKYRGLSLRLEKALNEIIAKDQKIKADFRSKEITAANFAKKLLSQIVFLYFLQKKGWFGVSKGQAWGSGSKDFLRELFEQKHGNYENFFNDIMEPLFYEALGWPRSGGYYSRFNSRIPFLNGGLFEPINQYDWIYTDILLPDEMFSNSRKTVGGDKGDGILDIFDLYNFTVKEDEPLEREVAVDPEMLGKVFENLLDPNARKSKGTYYTPRDIVYYMCQESLISYLNNELAGVVSGDDIEKLIRYGESVFENDATQESTNLNGKKKFLPNTVEQNAEYIDQKLASVRICDPAVGSGAFVVGMMSEIVRTRNALTPYMQPDPERILYNFKRDAIQDCLYGVDIDPGAVEIAKLRLWLSLIVDEEEQANIKPLPNLDYKIVKGDSLLGFPYTPRGLDKIAILKQEFFGETNLDIKQDLKRRIDKTIGQQLSSTNSSLGYKLDFDIKIFFWEVFNEKDGFDVIIGNPPYVQLQRMKDDPVREIYKKKQGYETYNSTGDIYCLFYEKASRLLKPGQGILSYITSNSWLRIAYGGLLRCYFSEHHTPLKLLELGKGIFENVTVATNILILRHGKSNKPCEGVDMDHLPHKNLPPEKTYWKQVRVEKEKPWIILSPIEHRIADKIEELGTPLKEWDITINRGILTGYDKAFVINNETKEALIREDPKSAEIIKPVLKGKDIQKYKNNWKETNRWLIATFPALKIGIDRYPAVKRHLLSFGKQRLEQTGMKFPKSRKKTIHAWYELQDTCAYYEEFSKNKIVWKRIGSDLRFAYCDEAIFCLDSTCIATGKSLKTLTAILNSRIARYQLFSYAPKTGTGDLLISVQALEPFLIPFPTKNQEEKIEEICRAILQAKSSNQCAGISDMETQIDQLAYELYGLTQEEISFIERAEFA